jgi:hypothetical protein
VDELLTEDPIAVAQQIAGHTLPRKSIPKLLHSPLRCRMLVLASRTEGRSMEVRDRPWNTENQSAEI